MATKKNPELDAFQKLVKDTVALELKSKAVTVQRLLPEIDRLCDLGYKHERLVEVMGAAGLDLTVGTFRSIRSRIKDKDGNKP